MNPAANRSTNDVAVQVLIIGAGPAGAAAGIVLAREGLDVCVVDRARFPRSKPCGDALSNRAVQLVESLLGSRAALEVLPNAPVVGSEVIFPDGERVRRSYSEPGRIIPRAILDAAIVDALSDAGARVVEGVPIRSLVCDGARARVTGAEAAGRIWRAQAVVAADGPGSVGGKALGRPSLRGRRLGVAATAYLDWSEPRTNIALHQLDHELPHGYGWIFPAVEGLANVGIFQRSDQSRQDPRPLRRRFFEFLDRQGLDPNAIRGDVRIWSLPISTSSTIPGAPGLLLCGDAAGLADPISGEGIWQALHSGALAGRTIAAALARPEGLSRSWVRRYQRACAREIGWPSIVRGAAGELMHRLIRWRLHRAPGAIPLVGWAYRRGSLEISKHP